MSLNTTEIYQIAIFIIAMVNFITLIITLSTIFIGYKKIRESGERVKLKIALLLTSKSNESFKSLKKSTIYEIVQTISSTIHLELSGISNEKTSFTKFTVRNAASKQLYKNLINANVYVDAFLTKYDRVWNSIDDIDKYNTLIQSLKKQGEEVVLDYFEVTKSFMIDLMELKEQLETITKEFSILKKKRVKFKKLIT